MKPISILITYEDGSRTYDVHTNGATSYYRHPATAKTIHERNVVYRFIQKLYAPADAYKKKTWD